MLPKWTGDVVGTLHVNSIEIRELAAKMGCAPEYLGKILNGKRVLKAERSSDRLPYIRAALSGWTGVWKDDYLLSQLHITPPSLPRHLREVQNREERLRGTQGFRV